MRPEVRFCKGGKQAFFHSFPTHAIADKEKASNSTPETRFPHQSVLQKRSPGYPPGTNFQGSVLVW